VESLSPAASVDKAAHHSLRWFAATALALLVALPAVRFTQNGGPIRSAIGFVIGALDIGVLPGLLFTMLAGAIATGSMLEAAAIGVGASLALVQMLTVAALWLHLSPPKVILVLWGGSCALAVMLFAWSPRRQQRAAITGWEWLVAALAVVVGAVLYAQNPRLPWLSGDEAMHVSVIQHLTFEPRPGLHNISPLPGMIWTYPFPGIHYFVALVSRAVDLEPIFVFQKLRAFWGPIALLTLYAMARLIFASERAAIASALAAAVLTLNGVFGPVSSTWGQLAPLSTPSDIAMTVVLPLLMLFALHFVVADTRRAAALYLCGALALAVILTVVAIRDVVQFLVYAGASWVVYRFVIKQRTTAFRLGAIVVATTALVVVYLKWYHAVAGSFDAIAVERRRTLIETFAALSPLHYLTPIFEHGSFVVNQQYFFYAWFPLVLILAPLALAAYSTHPLVPVVGASLLAYAVIVFVPVVSIAYVYLTYHEILFTPVRNSLVFIYVLAGPLLLLAADAIDNLRTRAVKMAAASAFVAALWIAYRFSSWAFSQPAPSIVKNAFFLTLIVGCTTALAMPRRFKAVRRLAAYADARRAPAMMPFLCLLAAAAMISVRWSSSPLNFDPASAKWTFRQYLAGMTDAASNADSTITDPETGAKLRLTNTTVTMAAPSAELVDFGRRILPTYAVIVHNLLNTYPSPVFMPEHIVMWPLDGIVSIESNERMFPNAWTALVQAVRTHGEQPFFNDTETLEERVAYMKRVRATHVLIDPMYYARLRSLFPQWAPAFTPVFDDGHRWAVLEFAAAP
jgi:hypothetical protein